MTPQVPYSADSDSCVTVWFPLSLRSVSSIWLLPSVFLPSFFFFFGNTPPLTVPPPPPPPLYTASLPLLRVFCASFSPFRELRVLPLHFPSVYTFCFKKTRITIISCLSAYLSIHHFLSLSVSLPLPCCDQAFLLLFCLRIRHGSVSVYIQDPFVGSSPSFLPPPTCHWLWVPFLFPFLFFLGFPYLVVQRSFPTPTTPFRALRTRKGRPQLQHPSVVKQIAPLPRPLLCACVGCC